jgi:hypothetical protein
VLSGQCLDRRISEKPALTEEVTAWEDSRNKKHVKADWQFTTANARVELKRLYPALHCMAGARRILLAAEGKATHLSLQRI